MPIGRAMKMMLLGCTIGIALGAIGTACLYAVEARKAAATERMLDDVCGPDEIQWTEEEIAEAAARAIERAKFSRGTQYQIMRTLYTGDNLRRSLARQAEIAARMDKYGGVKPPRPTSDERRETSDGIQIDMDRIIAIESSGNPLAVSSAGCRGLCQIAEATWNECVQRMGVTWTWDEDAWQPGENRAVGNYYINTRIPEMLRQYGIDDNHATRIGAYNWGIGNLRRAWERHGHDWLAHAPKETQDYVIKYATW